MSAERSLVLIRKRSGYSIKEAAEILGISACTLSDYEKTKARIPLSILIKLMNLYNCDVFDVFGVNEALVNIEYDIPKYYILKAHSEYLIRREAESDRKFGRVFPDRYYDDRLRKLINEYVNAPAARFNYPELEKDAARDAAQTNIKL